MTHYYAELTNYSAKNTQCYVVGVGRGAGNRFVAQFFLLQNCKKFQHGNVRMDKINLSYCIEPKIFMATSSHVSIRQKTLLSGARQNRKVDLHVTMYQMETKTRWQASFVFTYFDNQIYSPEL